MLERDRAAQARRAGGHGGRPDRHGYDPGTLAKALRCQKRAIGVLERHGHDGRRIELRNLGSVAFERLAESARFLGQGADAPGLTLEHAERGQRGGCDGWGQGRAENKGARSVQEKLAGGRIGGSKCPS